MGMPVWEVSDGDPDVAWRSGRGLSIPALLARCSEDKTPAIQKCCGRIFHAPMPIKTDKIIIKSTHRIMANVILCDVR